MRDYFYPNINKGQYSVVELITTTFHKYRSQEVNALFKELHDLVKIVR